MIQSKCILAITVKNLKTIYLILYHLETNQYTDDFVRGHRISTISTLSLRFGQFIGRKLVYKAFLIADSCALTLVK